MPADQKLRLSDLAVGQKFTSASASLSASEIKEYAVRFDPQPFHLDERAAANTIFGELVANGWHTASTAMRLIVQSVRFECGVIGIGGEITWLKPVRPDTAFHVESEITSITPSHSKPGQAIVVMKCLIKNDAGEPLIDLMPKLMVFDSKR